MDFREDLEMYIKDIEAKLSEEVYVSQNNYFKLEKAMVYSLFSKGKRIRPLLVIGCCRMMGGNYKAALNLGCAVECIHAASLIHDDMPCMDDSSLRRGVKTCHVEYGEATALLAGTALYYKALDFIVAASKYTDGEMVGDAVLDVVKLAGANGMMGGQQLDLEMEGKKVTKKSLAELDELKTSSLIKLACKFGGYASQVDLQDHSLLEEFGGYLGRAFQICDDVLDCVGDGSKLGKPTHKDDRRGKLNNATFYGVERAKEIEEELINEALELIDVLCSYNERMGLKRDPDFLKWLVEKMHNRTN